MTDTTSGSLTPRHWIALTALLSGMVALYLHLWKIGVAGPLVCTASHGCERAQFSPYGSFLGIDVALIGVLGYAAIFVVAIAGVQARWLNDRGVTRLLALLILGGFAFTLRLKYGEFIVLKTFCPWCLISAVTISLQVILVAVDWRRVKNER